MGTEIIRCAECGHSMVRSGRGWACAENACSIGLAVLGLFASAKRLREQDNGSQAVDLNIEEIRKSVGYYIELRDDSVK